MEYIPNNNYLFLKDYINSNIKSPEKIIQQIYYKNLITKIEIGTPPKKIPIFIKLNDNKFLITSNNPSKLSKEPKKDSKFYYFTDNELYNETLSSSYIEDKCEEVSHLLYHFSEMCYSKEKIIFYDFNEKSFQKEFQIRIIKNNDENIPGYIGLLFNNSNFESTKSFITLLRAENLINSYYYFFNFDEINPLENKINGNLIIGGMPHEVFPKKYSLNNYIYTSAYIEAFISSKWRIIIDKTYLNEEKNSNELRNNILTLSYNLYHIIGTYEFHNLIKDKFMDELIDEKKCFCSYFEQNINGNQNLTFYYCDKSAKNILYKNLSSIKFYSQNLDYTFELTKEELFYIKDEYIYFNILFSEHENTFWLMGQIFTTKYHFVFNTDQKQIGLYTKVNIDKTNDKVTEKNSYNILIIIVFIICIIIFICIGIFIGRKIFGWNRKVIANEIIEELDYEYKIGKNNDIEPNIKESKYKSIGNKDKNLFFEMKNKVSE